MLVASVTVTFTTLAISTESAAAETGRLRDLTHMIQLRRWPLAGQSWSCHLAARAGSGASSSSGRWDGGSGRGARLSQMEFVSGLIKGYRNVIIMGDLNCGCSSQELSLLLRNADLRMPYSNLSTYPSWNPSRHLDHILVSPTIGIESVGVLNYPFSDHLPIAMEISVPGSVFLPQGGHYPRARAA